MIGFYLPPLLAAASGQASGQRIVSNTVSRLGVPGKYKIRLLNRVFFELIAETVSNEDGSYTLVVPGGLPTGPYLVIAIDHSADQKNAAIADMIYTEPMP